jgi:hypothetical protein
MTLHIKNIRGNEVQIEPVRSTKQELIAEHGETFTLDGSDYLYHVHEVYAKKSPDTSFAAGLMMALFVLLITREPLAILSSFVMIFLIGKIYFYIDKKAVETFNNSKTF